MKMRTDILVIGAGGAGARAAIEAATRDPGLKIIILSQGPVGKSGLTAMANGGMVWVEHPDDSPDNLFEDILRYGCYLNEQNLVEALTVEGPQRAPGVDKLGRENDPFLRRKWELAIRRRQKALLSQRSFNPRPGLHGSP